MARPKRQFTDEEEQGIEQAARNNCYDRTISTALDIPIMTLKRRFGTKIRRWRALGKLDLREVQRKLAKTSSDMAKFLGTNELGQVVKSVIVDETKQRELDEAQKAEAIRIASIRLHQGVA